MRSEGYGPAQAADSAARALHLLGELPMLDFLLGLSFVAMILSPAIVITWQRVRAHQAQLTTVRKLGY